MKNRYFVGFICLVASLTLVFAADAMAAPKKIVIGHPACLSGKYAKAGEQALGGIKGIVDWVNKEYGGVMVGGKKVPLEYVYYDSESKKEAVTSLIARLITADKVNAVMAPYSSGLTLRGAPVAESRKMLYMDHGGANNKIFRQGFKYIVQTIGPASRYHEGTLDMIHSLHPKTKKVALAYEDSEFAKMVMEGAEAYAMKLGCQCRIQAHLPQRCYRSTPPAFCLEGLQAGLHYRRGTL